MQTVDSREISSVSGGHYCACMSKTPTRGFWDGLTIIGVASAAVWIYNEIDYQLAASRCRKDDHCVGVAEGIEKCQAYLGQEFSKCT